jgi:hypothetical protein
VKGRILSYPVAKLPHGDDGEDQAARLTGKLLNKELWGVRTGQRQERFTEKFRSVRVFSPALAWLYSTIIDIYRGTAGH